MDDPSDKTSEKLTRVVVWAEPWPFRSLILFKSHFFLNVFFGLLLINISFLNFSFELSTSGRPFFKDTSLLASTLFAKACDPVLKKIGAEMNSASSAQSAEFSPTRQLVSAKTEAAAALEILESQGDLARFELDESYSSDQVRDAHRRLARKWHPDSIANLGDAELIAIHDRAFQLVQQTYERLRANTPRRASVDQRVNARTPRAVASIKVDELVREHKERFLHSILSLEGEGLSSARVHQMSEALEFGRESSYSDPAAFIEARTKILLDLFSKAEPLVARATNIQQLENIRLAYQAFRLITGQSLDSFKNIFNRRWEKLSQKAEAQNLHRFLDAWLFEGDSLDWRAEEMINQVSDREGVSKSEVARQALVAYIQTEPEGILAMNPIVRAFLESWLAGRQNHSIEMQSIRQMILDTPHQNEFHRHLMSFYRRPDLNPAILNDLIKIFGTKFLVANDVPIGLVQSIFSRFQMTRAHDDLQAAEQVGQRSQTLLNQRAEQILGASLANDQAEIRIGQFRVALDSAEVGEISRMRFSKAQRYLREKYGIEVIVMPADRESPDLLAYHSYFASGPHAVFMPAGTSLNIGGYDRKFSDRPVIALQEHAQSSLTHEFAHYLLFEAVGRASDQAGIPHQILEAHSRSRELGEILQQRESDLWATPFRAGNRFSGADVSLYIDASLLAAQQDFQRIREEIFADQLELRARNIDPQTRQRKIEHLSFELKLFEENINKVLASLQKRVVRLNAYLTAAETRQFHDAIESLQALVSRLDAAVLDLDNIGPIEAILQREADVRAIDLKLITNGEP